MWPPRGRLDPLLGLSVIGRDPIVDASKLFLIPQNSFLMPQNLFLMPQNTKIRIKAPDQSEKSTTKKNWAGSLDGLGGWWAMRPPHGWLDPLLCLSVTDYYSIMDASKLFLMSLKPFSNALKLVSNASKFGFGFITKT